MNVLIKLVELLDRDLHVLVAPLRIFAAITANF